MPRPKKSVLQRSEVVTVRFDPRLRYLVELAARKHRRTVSSFLEWAAERAVMELTIGEKIVEKEVGSPELREVSFGEWSDLLWDVDRPDRLVKLALGFPDLLTYDEQVIWKRIQEDRDVWRAEPPSPLQMTDWTVIDFQLVRSRWSQYIKGVNDADEE